MSIPNYALYGTQAEVPWAEMVHFEWIPERSGVHNFDIAPHVHDALVQVLYITKSGGEVLMDGERRAMAAPCLVVIPSRVVHGFRFERDVEGPVITAAQRPLETLAAAASPALLATLRRPAVIAVPAGSRHAEALMPLFLAIERESRAGAAGGLAAGMPLLVALIVQIARLGEEGAGEGGARTRKAALIERLRVLVDAHFREHLPVEHYSGKLGMSASQLGRLCREVLGMSTLDLINARLIHEAQRELVYSTLSVKQIAGLLGFDDEAYFGRFFRKNVGHRPTEFRDIARQRLTREPA